jgi:hypothetical protein
MSADEHTVVRAFVGRSFLKEDEPVWNDIRKILQSIRPIGFEFEDASEAQPRPISKKVRDGIDRNDVYVGILTRRYLINREAVSSSNVVADERWRSSDWIVQESGYALGRSKRVIMLLENGVDFPKSDLDADQERILFDRREIVQCSAALTSMILNLVTERIERFVPRSEAKVAPPPSNLTTEGEVEKRQQSTMADVFELLDKDNIEQAKRTFEAVLSSARNEFGRTMLKSWYLEKRAVMGDSSSLEELRKLSRDFPENWFVWTKLAQYYANFNKFTDASEILMLGAEKVTDSHRWSLIGAAANYLANDRNFAGAYELVRKSVLWGDSADLRKALLAVTDIAQLQKEPNVASTALERALDGDPTDSGSRFRLAFLYAEHDKPHLAMYHYHLRRAQGTDTATANNLALAFGSLQLQGKEIELLKEASKDESLAKANLASAYLERGFLEEAEQLAESALKNGDAQARARAADVLQQISERRRKESDLQETITRNAEEERRFRARYAEAFISEQRHPLAGNFEASFGSFHVQQQDANVLGTYEHSEQLPSFSVANLLNLPALQPTPNYEKPTTRTETLEFRATLQGRAGRFHAEKWERTDNPVLLGGGSKKWEATGLIIVAPDGGSCELLNENESPCQLLSVRKLSEPPAPLSV